MLQAVGAQILLNLHFSFDTPRALPILVGPCWKAAALVLAVADSGGAVIAQLVEHVVGNDEVLGSIPNHSSTLAGLSSDGSQSCVWMRECFVLMGKAFVV